MMYGLNRIGKNCIILENVKLGYPGGTVLERIRTGQEWPGPHLFEGVTLGDNALIRPDCTLYCGVSAGVGLRTGHNALIRESTSIGDHTLVGTNVVIDGNTRIGSNVSIQSNVYIPTNTTIEDNVFLGPCSVLANDKYPVRVMYDLKGPILRKGASIGANATILPDVEIGEGAFVAAGALVTKDVPAWKLAIGSPARVSDLPDKLITSNRF
jgi:acetyltransferase-like isoleucine patch superfamily enzyme